MFYGKNSQKKFTKKFHNCICYVDGFKFDSKKEADRYKILSILQQNNQIKDLRLQVPFLVIPKLDNSRACYYYADFVYRLDGKLIVEDVKGYKTDVYKLKKKLMKWLYDINIQEV